MVWSRGECVLLLVIQWGFPVVISLWTLTTVNNRLLYRACSLLSSKMYTERWLHKWSVSVSQFRLYLGNLDKYKTARLSLMVGGGVDVLLYIYFWTILWISNKHYSFIMLQYQIFFRFATVSYSIISNIRGRQGHTSYYACWLEL